MWQFLAVLAIAGGLLDAIRGVEERLGAEPGPEPSKWTQRTPDAIPHFALPCELEKDLWKSHRGSLEEDIWESQREQIDDYLPGEWAPPLLERKRFILERMYGGPHTFGQTPPRDVAE